MKAGFYLVRASDYCDFFYENVSIKSCEMPRKSGEMSRIAAICRCGVFRFPWRENY